MSKKKNKKKGEDGDKGAAPVSPVTRKYREAVVHLEAGDLVRSVRGFLKILEDEPASEEAFFCVTQIRRLRLVHAAEMKEAAFDNESFEALVSKRRENFNLEMPTKALVGFMFAASAWLAVLAIAPAAALIGKGPDVPLIMRLVAGFGCALGLGIATGFLQRKWESVTFFIIWIPPILILTFIGVIEATDWLTRILCVLAFAAEITAAWYVSRFSPQFVF